MNRRAISIALAVVLGIVGTIVLVRYVQSARDDAAEPEPTSEILVVTGSLRQGASLEEVRASVTSTQIPDVLVADGALDTLDDLDPELVVAFPLEPGEQLLRGRLALPDELVSVDLPAGLQELTVSLDPERAVGGQIEPGSTVGVVISFEPFELSASGTPAADPAASEVPAAPEVTVPNRTPNTTHLTLNGILVTSVQLSRDDAERTTQVGTTDDSGDEPVIAADVSEAPGNRLLVTVAVSAPEVEQIVFAAEFGRIWLTGQNAQTDETGSRVLTLGQVYVEVPR